MQRWKLTRDLLQLILGDIHLQTDLSTGLQRPREQHRQRLDLFPLPRVGPRLAIGDQLGRRFGHRIDDAQPVGPQRGAGLCPLDDGIHQQGGLDLRRAPGVFHLCADAVAFQVAFGRLHQLRGDTLPLQVLDALYIRILRHRQHPAIRLGRRLAIDQVRYLDHVGVVL